MSEIQALVHDVFGTVVDWRSAVTADGEALGRPQRNHRRRLAAIRRRMARRLRAVDEPGAHRRVAVDQSRCAASHGAWTHCSSKFGIAGKLTEEDKVWFNLTWHRLKPWPDSVPGLTRIKKKYIIATLSNGTVRLLTDMAKHCGLPWDTVLGSDLVRHYKPDAEMYRSAIEFLGSGDPSAVMMVAAHNNDLVARRRARHEDRLCRPALRARRKAGARLQGRARFHLRRYQLRASCKSTRGLE